MKNIMTICYGKKEYWNSRDEALAHFEDCLSNSEGSEQNRYANILAGLLEGKNVCSDEEDF